MHAIFDRADLHRVLEFQVSKEGRNLVDLFSLILIKLENGIARVISSSGQEVAESWTQAQVVSEGSVCVKFKVLYDLVKDLSSREVVINSDFERKRVIVSSGKSKYRLAMFDAQDFPLPVHGSSSKALALSALELKRILDLVSFVVNPAGGVENTDKVLMAPRGEAVEFVSADSSRMALVRAKFAKSKLQSASTISHSSVEALRRFCSCLGDNNVIEISDDGKFLIFQAEYSSLSVLKPSPIFIDYQSALNRRFPHYVTFNHKDLEKAVRRISNLTQTTRPVKIVANPNKLLLLVKNSELGDGEEEVDVFSSSGGEISTFVQISFLSDFLKLQPPGERSIMDFNTPSDALRMRFEGADFFEYYFMPSDEV